VSAGKNAYLILQPEYICGPTVKEVIWSQDGQRLAILREFVEVKPSVIADLVTGAGEDRTPNEPETQILTWNTVTRTTTTLMKFSHSQGEILSMDWIAGSSSLAIQAQFVDPADTTSRHTSILILNGKGETLTVEQVEPGRTCEILPSPVKPVVALLERPSSNEGPPGSIQQAVPANTETIRFFGTGGNLSQPTKLPGRSFGLQWSNGGLPYVKSFEVQEGDKKEKRVWYLVNRETLKLEPSETSPFPRIQDSAQADEELEVQALSAKLAGNKLGIYVPTVVISPPQAKDAELTVITTDGDEAKLSPKSNGVSYQSQGSLMVREMVKVPLEAYRRAREAALKERLINQAKQVGFALMMYCNDWDDNMLSNSGNWQEQLLPYLRNQSLMDGFTYTFAGGNSANIPDPANTAVGYIEGPGGRAVAYADGHVRWVPNP